MTVKRLIFGVLTVPVLFVAATFIWWNLKYESLVGDDIQQVVPQMTASGALLIFPDEREIYQKCMAISQVHIVPRGFPSLIIFDVEGCRVDRVRMGWRK